MYHIIFKSLKTILAQSAISVAFFIPFSSLAQDFRKIDSLKTRLEHTQNFEHCDILFKLVQEHANWNNPTSLQYALDGYDFAKTLGDSLRIAKASRYKGQAYRRMDNLEESVKAFSEGLKITFRHKSEKPFFDEYKIILNGIAITYTYFADYDKALEFNLKALEIREADGDKGETSIVLNNIGLVYYKMRNYNIALKYYEQSLAYKMESKDYFDLDRLYLNTGLCYNQIRNFPKAQKNFEAAFSICKNDCSNQIKLEGDYGLGVSNYFQSKFDEAILHLKKSFEISKETNNKRFMAENLVYLGKIYIAKKDLESAVEFLNQAESLVTNTEYNELIVDIYRQFSILYNLRGDYQNAAAYQNKYIVKKDSIYSEDLIGNLAKIQTNYAERENIKTIAAKEEVIQRQRSLNIAIIIIAVLAGLLIFVLYRSNHVKQKVNRALSDAKAIIEDQNKQLLNSNFSLDRELKERNIDLQKANESLQRVNEELDNFIYKTSHDIRGPLASLKGMCNVALMDVTDQLALNYLKKLDITAEKLNTILTRLLIVNQINASALGSEKIDFASIVGDVLQLEKKKGLPPKLNVKTHIDDTIIYHSDKEFVRIILENLIDNAIKFYNDSDRIEPFVDISVSEEDNHVKIKVVDNGIGISQVHPDKIFQMFSRASERSETGGIGLYITKTAAEKLGGAVHLKTTPEGYTEFFVTLPLALNRVLVN